MTYFLAGMSKLMFEMAPVTFTCGAYSCMLRMHHAKSSKADGMVASAITHGSMCRWSRATPKRSALSIILLAISSFFAGSAGMPSWSQVSPTTSQSVPAISGKMVSHLVPSSLTEFTMPGLFTCPSSMIRASSWASGLSMHSLVSDAACITPMSQTMASYSSSVAVLGAQSRKSAPAAA